MINQDPICEAPTHKELVRRLWAATPQFPPPQDGRHIVAIGRVIYQFDPAAEDGMPSDDENAALCTAVEPFVALIRWTENPGESKGWHHVADSLSVARTLEDEVKIDFWLEDPR